MTRTFKASITYDTDAQHPDIANGRGLVFSDTYRMDTNWFYDREAMEEHITEDMYLVAGGGYDWKHITNITMKIEEVFND